MELHPFTIAESGRAVVVTTRGMSEAPEVGLCFAGAIRRIAFPPPTGGIVTFPFSFTLAT